MCGRRFPINHNAQTLKKKRNEKKNVHCNRFHLVLTFAIYIYPNRVMEHYWLQARMMVLQEYGQKMVS